MSTNLSLPRTTWTARITAEAEPVLLARLLQKLTCQGATIHSLHYELGRVDSALATVEIIFSAEDSRAMLLAKQWRTIIAVRRVELTHLQTKEQLARTP